MAGHDVCVIPRNVCPSQVALEEGMLRKHDIDGFDGFLVEHSRDDWAQQLLLEKARIQIWKVCALSGQATGGWAAKGSGG